MKVLSLFGVISCRRAALKRVELSATCYIPYEVNKHATLQDAR